MKRKGLALTLFMAIHLLPLVAFAQVESLELRVDGLV